jgi:hypothetical protein
MGDKCSGTGLVLSGSLDVRFYNSTDTLQDSAGAPVVPVDRR